MPATTNRYLGIYPVAIVLLSALLVCKLLYLVLTFSQGFDVADEGMHMLMYKYPGEYPVNIHNYQYFITALLPDSLITVFNLRIAWLISELAGWLVLFWGCIVFLRNNGVVVSKATAVLFVLFGANALALSIHDRIIAYNALSNLFINTSAGLLLMGLNSQLLTARHRLLIAATFFLIGLQLFIKPTVAVGAGVMEFVLCLIYFRDKALQVLSISVAGVVAALVFAFLFVLPPLAIWWPNYIQGFELAHVSGYGSQGMLLYMYGLPTAGYLLLLFIPNKIVSAIIKRIGTHNIFPVRYIAALLIAGHIVSCLVVWFCLHVFLAGSGYSLETLKESPNTFYSPVLLLPNTIIYQWFSARIRFAGLIPFHINFKMLMVGLFLFVTPYLIFFGAASPIDASIYGHLLPAMALLFIIPYITTGLEKTRLYYLAVVTLLCSALFIQHYIFYPTRILQPLYSQIVNAGNGEKVLMDSASASFINTLKGKINRHGQFKYATHIGLAPGFVYLLGFKQPGNGYYISLDNKDMEKLNADFNEYFYRNYISEIIQGPVLIDAGASVMDKGLLDNSMREKGYSMLLVDSAYNPYIQREIDCKVKTKQPYTYIYIPGLRQ